MIEKLVIRNPKRDSKIENQENLFPYYAGFSSKFVSEILESSGLNNNMTVVDPWNGSGTTTTTASSRGVRAYGYDLNPVMVIAAKANLLKDSELSSITPLAYDIISRAEHITDVSALALDDDDSLNIWFLPSYARGFRKIEMAVQKILVDATHYRSLTENGNVDDLSCLASFYYVALFRCIRKFLVPFNTSNPTWIKVPHQSKRLRPSFHAIVETFKSEVDLMKSLNRKAMEGNLTTASVKISSSCLLPEASNFADLVITSPPYCTRIDYAIATMPELTLLGYKYPDAFNMLRRELIGSSMVPKEYPSQSLAWGGTCNAFLEKISRHNSKASGTYYLKNHLQYFNSIFKSVSEIARTLAPQGGCIMVVQDSYYKDIHNNLSKIMIEMGDACGLNFKRREDFFADKNMARINPKAKKYRVKSDVTESVICFQKQ